MTEQKSEDAIWSRSSRPVCKVNFLCNWFISLKRHHNTHVEKVLLTESVAMMAFCCTFVRLSFFIFLPPFLDRWTLLFLFGIRFSWEGRKEYGRCGCMEYEVAVLGRWEDKLKRAVHIPTFPKALIVYTAVGNVSCCCCSFKSQILGSVL